MRRGRIVPAAVVALLASGVAACARGAAPQRPAPVQANTPATPAVPPGQAGGGVQDSAAGQRPGGGSAAAPRPYNRVITTGAETKAGLFKVHRVNDRLYFEIPRRELGRELLVISRTVAGGSTSGFFGGGPNRVVTFHREGSRILLRQESHSVAADSNTAIYRAVSALSLGPVIASFNVETWGPDSAAVIEVTRLFTTNVNEFAVVNQVQADRSFVQSFAAFPENVNVEALQTGTQPAQGGPGGGPGGGGAGARPTTVSAVVSWSFYKLPEQPMRPRLHDRRVGINSISHIDYSRPEHGAETRRYIRRYRLEKQNPNAAVSDPVRPITFWIDAATPEWLVPWVKKGIEEWEPAYREAGFSNAIVAREAPAPSEDPQWSMYDARHSMIYWRPSDVANATGGQVVDPRTGEIIKAEVNMYHNVMNLLRNWYFTQVSPLDRRAQQLPLPDTLMGRLVQYVVAHEVGHAIGFPHNMKASSQYPVDSLRSATFLRRMGGHVATLMDYSRFNYVAQPEDNIPVELLIPGVGPYDRFAIMWQNKPIPGARTPDEEWDTLNSWSRMQDTIPWFRWSTTDATADAGDLTEAVGDEDAVKATQLAMRNLQRVVNSLLSVAEKPGRDYTLLSELYSNAVSQWGRYNAHVAAVVGGADTQEKYGTGRRFQPLPEARQKEAVEYLARNSFQVPAMFLNPEILYRIEQDGAVNRIARAQAGVLNSLMAASRLNRLVDYEALAGPNGDAYTVAELLGDLRRHVWTELSQSNPTVDVYRRNLQRAYIEAAERTINPPQPPAQQGGGPGGPGGAAAQPQRPGDARALLRGELFELQRAVLDATNRTRDAMTRLHLRDIHMEIQRILAIRQNEIT